MTLRLLRFALLRLLTLLVIYCCCCRYALTFAAHPFPFVADVRVDSLVLVTRWHARVKRKERTLLPCCVLPHHHVVAGYVPRLFCVPHTTFLLRLPLLPCVSLRLPVLLYLLPHCCLRSQLRYWLLYNVIAVVRRSHYPAFPHCSWLILVDCYALIDLR